MAWNEPGGSGDKDPWGSRDREQGPPDLDEIVRKLQSKLSGLLGGGGAPGLRGGGRGLIALTVLVMALWALSGIYIVDPAERGVVLRFGKLAYTTLPGPHWHIPFPIESVELVDVADIRNVEVGYRSGAPNQPPISVPNEALMLTQDQNIIDIQLAVQYRVKSASAYLFNVRDPDATLRRVTESAVREVIGKSKMDFVLTEGRSEIAAHTLQLLQEIMDRYNTGLQVTSVNMQDAKPPEEVQEAFHDVVKASEDEQRLKNEAEAYANDIVPKARGAAARQIEDANAYKAQVVAQAEGEASRFQQVLAQYDKAPQVTRERLYLDALESVLESSTKVVVDIQKGGNLFMLPLDHLLSSQRPAESAPELSPGAATAGSTAAPKPDLRNPERLRSRSDRDGSE
jgi:membrane protease subunit HflK